MKILVLKEGSRPFEIGYHFTNLDGLLAIAKSDFMKATNEPVKDKQVPTGNYTFTDEEGTVYKITKKDYEILHKFFTETSNARELYKLTDKRMVQVIFQGTKADTFDKLEPVMTTPYKDMTGKKTWSYTRRPEGMSYRNMKTFGKYTVRIGINIDKLTERYVIAPFSWIRYSKNNGDMFEFEERVFKKGKKQFEGTDNFSQYITEIAVDSRMSETLSGSFFSFFPYRINKLSNDIKNSEKFLKDKTDDINKCRQFIDTLKSDLDWFKISYALNKLDKGMFRKDISDTEYEDFEIALNLLKEKNPDIVVKYINPSTLKDDSYRYDNDTIKAYLREIELFGETYYDIPVEALENKLFDDFIIKYNKEIDNFSLKHADTVLIELKNKYEELKNSNKSNNIDVFDTCLNNICNFLELNKNDVYVAEKRNSLGLLICKKSELNQLINKYKINLISFDDLLLAANYKGYDFVFGIMEYVQAVKFTGKKLSSILQKHNNLFNELTSISVYTKDIEYKLTKKMKKGIQVYWLE